LPSMKWGFYIFHGIQNAGHIPTLNTQRPDHFDSRWSGRL
jgi:hypothetical protein